VNAPVGAATRFKVTVLVTVVAPLVEAAHDRVYWFPAVNPERLVKARVLAVSERVVDPNFHT
jgi:hypothetical protein